MIDNNIEFLYSAIRS